MKRYERLIWLLLILGMVAYCIVSGGEQGKRSQLTDDCLALNDSMLCEIGALQWLVKQQDKQLEYWIREAINCGDRVHRYVDMYGILPEEVER